MNGTRDEAGRQRVVIEEVTPEIDGGRFPVQRVFTEKGGEKVVVEADAFTDGQDAVTCRLLYRPGGPAGGAAWSEAAMLPLPPPQNDRWRGELTVGAVGRWQYTVTAWVDPFKTWRRGRDAGLDLGAGAALIREAGRRAEEEGKKPAARILAGLAQDLEAGTDPEARLRLALDDELAQLMDRHADRRSATTWRALDIVVDRERARFSSWFEIEGLPLKDAAARLPAVARMGFDVLSLRLADAERGEDFRRFREKAEGLGIEIAVHLNDPSGIERWIAEGVRIFCADSPDNVPFPLWEQLIGEVKREHPDVLFLAEAVARPKAARRLAKLGFTWSRVNLTSSFTELHHNQDVSRPNLMVSSPSGGLIERTAFVQRLLLAATLGASYSLSAPFLAESGGDTETPDSLRELIALIHKIRRENPALQTDRGLRFHPTDNEQILCFSKVDDKRDNTILVTVNLDLEHVQSGWVELPVADLGLPRDQPYQVHDLLTGARYLWHGTSNFVQLDPQSIPAHIFRVRRRVRSGKGSDAFI